MSGYKTSAEYQSAYLGCTEALDALITERDEALKEAEFYEIECSAARQEVDDAQADAKALRAEIAQLETAYDRASLPQRVVVDENGAFWRWYEGTDTTEDYFSMCPVSTDNDSIVEAATYVPADALDNAEKTIAVLLEVLPRMIVEAAQDFHTSYMDGRQPELSEDGLRARLDRIVSEKFSAKDES
jgi:hypothetical protein